MVLSATTVGHTVIGGEDRINVFDDGGGTLTQGMAIVDELGAQAGIASNPTRISGPQGSRYVSSALENEVQVKASAGTLWELTVTADSAASQRYVHVFDQVGALAGGETPVARFLLPAGGQVTYTPVGGLALSTGLVVATSTTLATYTSPGDTVVALQVDYT